jgi:hypothetical protein
MRRTEQVEEADDEASRKKRGQQSEWDDNTKDANGIKAEEEGSIRGTAGPIEWTRQYSRRSGKT